MTADGETGRWKLLISGRKQTARESGAAGTVEPDRKEPIYLPTAGALMNNLSFSVVPPLAFHHQVSYRCISLSLSLCLFLPRTYTRNDSRPNRATIVRTLRVFVVNRVFVPTAPGNVFRNFLTRWTGHFPANLFRRWRYDQWLMSGFHSIPERTSTMAGAGRQSGDLDCSRNTSYPVGRTVKTDYNTMFS